MRQLCGCEFDSFPYILSLAPTLGKSNPTLIDISVLYMSVLDSMFQSNRLFKVLIPNNCCSQASKFSKEPGGFDHDGKVNVFLVGNVLVNSRNDSTYSDLMT